MLRIRCSEILSNSVRVVSSRRGFLILCVVTQRSDNIRKHALSLGVVSRIIRQTHHVCSPRLFMPVFQLRSLFKKSVSLSAFSVVVGRHTKSEDTGPSSKLFNKVISISTIASTQF